MSRKVDMCKTNVPGAGIDEKGKQWGPSLPAVLEVGDEYITPDGKTRRIVHKETGYYGEIVTVDVEV